jgi:hypothetical protein
MMGGIRRRRAMADHLNAGEGIERGQSLWSANGRYRLRLQDDGNLVLYDGDAALWASDTVGAIIHYGQMQEDGNFVLTGGGPVWATGTDRNPGASLLLQDDGNLVVYARGGRALWHTNTAG